MRGGTGSAASFTVQPLIYRGERALLDVDLADAAFAREQPPALGDRRALVTHDRARKKTLPRSTADAPRSRRVLRHPVRRQRDRGTDRADVEAAEPVLRRAVHHLRRELALRLEQGWSIRSSSVPVQMSTVHEDGLALADAMHAVGRLLLDRGVPPAVEVEDVVRCPAGSSRGPPALIEITSTEGPSGSSNASSTLLALPRRQPAVEEADLGAEPRVQIRNEPVEAWVNCVKTKRLVALRHLLEQLDEPVELATSALERLAACEQELRVVAHPLQLAQHREHRAALAEAVLLLLDPRHPAVDRRLVEARLLDRQLAVVLADRDRRQLELDLRVVLRAPQHERPHDPAQALERRLVAVRLDRPRERAVERLARSPSSPGLTMSMIAHSSPSRFSIGVPVIATRRPR